MREDQKLLDIVKAVETVTGTRVHRSTAIRWVKLGTGGVVLQSRRVGGRFLTSIEWVRQFIDARSLPSSRREHSNLPLEPGVKVRNKQIDQAAERLSKLISGRSRKSEQPKSS